VITSQAQSIKAFVGPPGAPLPFETEADSPLSALDDQNTNTKTEGEANPDTDAPAREEKWFQLDVSPSDFIHDKYIKSTITNPLYRPYKPVRPETSFLAGTLKQTVLPSLWAKGLRDWETDAVRRKEDVPLEVEEEKGFQGSAGGRDRNKASSRIASTYVAKRFQRRQETARPRVMKGLRALREERERMEAEALRQETG